MSTNEKEARLRVPSRCSLWAGFATAALAGAAPPVSAQVTDWNFFKVIEYQQTANNTRPTTPSSFFANSIIFMTNASDIDAAEITSVAGIQPYVDLGNKWEIDLAFGTLAELNMAFPGDTTYTINITSGTLAPSLQQFTIGPDRFSNLVPFLTGNSFDALQLLDPANAIALTWDSAASASAANSLLSIEHLVPGDGAVTVFETLFAPNVTGFVLPGGPLIEGEEYCIAIGYITITPVAADVSGFNAPGLLGNFKATSFEFVSGGSPAAPTCLGDASGDGIVTNFNDITSVLSNWLSVCP